MILTGEIIKQKRTELGLTLKEAADKLGVSESTLSRYESGDIKKISMNTVVRMCGLFNIEITTLISEDGDQALKNNKSAHTLAAHFDGDEYTEEELEEIKRYAEFVKSKRNKD